MKSLLIASALLVATLAACATQSNSTNPAGEKIPAASNTNTSSPPPSALLYDVHAYGAKGDGTTVDSPAINNAIAAASHAGGGTVYFRAGTYASYSIHLQSNVAIYLDHGAVLLAANQPAVGRERVPPPDSGPPGSHDPRAAQNVAATPTSAPAPQPPAKEEPATDGWDRAEPNPWDMYQDYGHSHFHNSFLWGENLHDISILGPGMIDGRGLVTNADASTRSANKSLALKLCRNVTLRDVTFYRGGHFAILATGVDNFTLDNVKFDTNRDAIDIDSCKNVRVSNCYVNSPIDDGICLKSDYALGFARPCENVTIANCQVSGYVTGSLIDGTFNRTNRSANGDGPIGRIKFGTESNGGFKNITISNCVFDHCRGLAIESVDGGFIEDVNVSNITMRDIGNSPIFIRLGDRARGPKDSTPVAQIRRISISNLTASGVNSRYPVLLAGLPGHPIEDVRLSNIRIAYLGGGTARQAAATVAENESKYPEPSMFGVLPASAFYIRHVKGLEMHHIDVTFDNDDARPAIVLSDVAGADFQHMQIQRFVNVPYFSLNKVSDFSTQFVRSIADLKRDTVENEKISN